MSIKRVDIEGQLPAQELEFDGQGPSGEIKVQEFGGVDYGVRRSTVPAISVCCLNTIIGAGILGLPASIAAVGWGNGIIMFVLGAVCTQIGLHMLSSVAHKIGGDQLSFGAVAGHLNPWFAFLVDFLVWFICFFICVLYVGTAADFLVDAAKYMNPEANASGEWYMSRTFFLTLVWLGIAGPLSFPRKVTILQYSSYIATIFIFYTVVLVVIYAGKPVEELCEHFMEKANVTECIGEHCCLPSGECCIGEIQAFTGDALTFLNSMAVLVTSYCCSIQMFSFYNDLVEPSVARMNKASMPAIVLCTILYLAISFGGLFTYGSAVSSDLLGSYPLTLEVTICRIGLAFLVTVSYPLLMHPCRDATVNLVARIAKEVLGKTIDDPRQKSGKITYYVCLFVSLVATYCLGLVEIDMGMILGLGGTFSVSNLSFTIPAIYYWIFHKDEGYSTMRLLCIPIGILGITIMVVNIVNLFL